MLGHTQQATSGKVKLPNCHPFRIDGLVGAHNGIVWNHTELNKSTRKNYLVDSMQIFNYIANDLDLQDVETYGAIEYYDTHDKFAYLGRFGGNVYAAAVEDDARKDVGVVWSSMRDDLETALTMAGLRYSLYGVRDKILYKVVEGVMYETGKKLNFSVLDLSSCADCDDYPAWRGKESWTFRDGNWEKIVRDSNGNVVETSIVHREKRREDNDFHKSAEESARVFQLVCDECGQSVYGKPYHSTYVNGPKQKDKPMRLCNFCYDTYYSYQPTDQV